MRRRECLVCLVWALLATPALAIAGELEGAWRVESVEKDGQADRSALDMKYKINDEPEKVTPFTYVNLKGRSVWLNWGQPGHDFTSSSGYDLRIRLRDGEPRRLDIVAPRGFGIKGLLKSTYPGVYRLDGDRLTVTFAEPGKPRPTDPEARTVEGETKVVLRRGGPPLVAAK
jgi:uncharacterized protein (TIGR03067 family)